MILKPLMDDVFIRALQNAKQAKVTPIRDLEIYAGICAMVLPGDEFKNVTVATSVGDLGPVADELSTLVSGSHLGAALFGDDLNKVAAIVLQRK